MTGYQDEFNSSEMLGQESQNNEETSVGSVMSEEIWPNYCNPSYRMPSTIDVRVSVNQGEYDFPVTIIKAVLSSKNYLGERRRVKWTTKKGIERQIDRYLLFSDAIFFWSYLLLC